MPAGRSVGIFFYIAGITPQFMSAMVFRKKTENKKWQGRRHGFNQRRRQILHC